VKKLSIDTTPAMIIANIGFEEKTAILQGLVAFAKIKYLAVHVTMMRNY